MTDRWIRCVECNQVAHLTAYDYSPRYHCDDNLEEIREEPMDDRKHFMVQHRNHKMEELTVTKNSLISEGRYGEPLKVSYCEATNGEERFVIKRWREDITAPLQYELIPGHIKTSFHLEVQSDEIRRQMSEEITLPPIAEGKIEQFIQIIKMVVSQSPMRDSIEITAETDTPLVSYCKMDTNYIKKISSLGKDVFNEEELKKVEQFVYRNNNYNKPMTLLLKRTFTIKRRLATPIEAKKEQSFFNEAVAKRSDR